MQYLMFIGPCIIVIVEGKKTKLMSLAVLFHFLCAQHVSGINLSIIRSLRLCCWITTSVVIVLGSMCVGDSVWLVFSGGRVAGWSTTCASASNTDTTKNQPHQTSNTQRTYNITTNVVIQQHSRKPLMMDILMPEIFCAHKKWNNVASDIK